MWNFVQTLLINEKLEIGNWKEVKKKQSWLGEPIKEAKVCIGL